MSLRGVGIAALCVALLTAGFIGVASSLAARAPSPAKVVLPKTFQAKVFNGTGVRVGSVDWATLPLASQSAQQATLPTNVSRVLAPLDRMTTAQRKAYWMAAQSGKIKTPVVIPSPKPGALATPTISPNFDSCGYQPLPCLTYSHVGLDSTQSNGQPQPYQTIASNPGYVFDGVNNQFVVYDFAGNVVSGPVTANSFFASVLRPGDYLGDSQALWDATRDR